MTGHSLAVCVFLLQSMGKANFVVESSYKTFSLVVGVGGVIALLFGVLAPAHIFNVTRPKDLPAHLSHRTKKTW
jgi:membrane-bound ClpP family serine protease